MMVDVPSSFHGRRQRQEGGWGSHHIPPAALVVVLRHGGGRLRLLPLATTLRRHLVVVRGVTPQVLRLHWVLVVVVLKSVYVVNH